MLNCYKNSRKLHFGPILGQKRIFREFKFCHFFVFKFLSLGKIKIKNLKNRFREKLFNYGRMYGIYERTHEQA